jgi:hypothetical protein
MCNKKYQPLAKKSGEGQVHFTTLETKAMLGLTIADFDHFREPGVSLTIYTVDS